MKEPFLIGRVCGAAKHIGGGGCVDGWEYLGKGIWPEPGLVMGHPASVGSGHVSIVDFDGEGIVFSGVVP